jgi:peptidoglycan/xylan/chitin deacetylase (PgdA/CDA1 family)
MTLPESPVIVLLYHDIVSDSEWDAVKGDIGISTLLDHFRCLKRAGFEFVSLQTAFALAAGDLNDGVSKCTITFDDALEGVHTYRRDFLPEIGHLATVFVLTSYVGSPNLWNTRSPVISRHMTLPMLIELQSLGCDLQLHGVDHHHLGKFSVNQLRDRFSHGIAWFEENLARKPRYLSYPYGAFDAVIAGVVDEFFEGAVSVNHGTWSGKQSHLGLNRISVPGYLSGEGLLEAIRCPSSSRWMEMEKRAPWRRGSDAG